jgi:hypothetical protein
MTCIIPHNTSTWPENVIETLAKFRGVFCDWYSFKDDETPYSDEKERRIRIEAFRFDSAIHILNDSLSEHYVRGYHCTKLTDAEIEEIIAHGMSLPTGEMLLRRIHSLERARQISSEIAAQFRSKHQADEEFRANRLWFCFFEPYKAGEHGIESLCRYWGGEALYNSHDRHPETRPVLLRIGTPCLVEADVAAKTLSPNHLALTISKAYARSIDLSIDCNGIFADRTTRPIPAKGIKRIIRYPDDEFIALTRCDQWEPPL